MEYTLIFGALFLGWMVPELCNAIGGGKTNIPYGVNIFCACGAVLIATYVAFGA